MLIKMDWTSLYLKTANLNVFILGTGEVATRRANKFLDHGANVKLAGDVLDKELIDKGAVLASVDDVVNLVQWSDVVVIASGDRELSDYVSKIAEDKLLNRADFPDNGNIIVPTSFNIGDVEISIFTNGKSPLMARQLRKKIQSIITEEDILEIELQISTYVTDRGRVDIFRVHVWVGEFEILCPDQQVLSDKGYFRSFYDMCAIFFRQPVRQRELS